MENQIDWKHFTQVEMRVGTIVKAEVFEGLRKPAYKMLIDFGEYGIKKTSAQITDLYETEKLIGTQVVAVVNFPAKQIANMMSECLVLGAVGDESVVTLLQPERKVVNGTKIA